MDLHQTAEFKELLSEHLCTVIQENEIRKAKKLAELLEALSIDANSGSETVKDPASLLLYKTPTPGMDIWPKRAGQNQDGLSVVQEDRNSDKGRTGPDNDKPPEACLPVDKDGRTETSENTMSVNSEQSQCVTEATGSEREPPSTSGGEATGSTNQQQNSSGTCESHKPTETVTSSSTDHADGALLSPGVGAETANTNPQFHVGTDQHGRSHKSSVNGNGGPDALGGGGECSGGVCESSCEVAEVPPTHRVRDGDQAVESVHSTVVCSNGGLTKTFDNVPSSETHATKVEETAATSSAESNPPSAPVHSTWSTLSLQ